MEEAQKELEKNAMPGQRPDDDDDDDDEASVPRLGATTSSSADVEHRSVRSSDRDLLDGADASAGAFARDNMEHLVEVDSQQHTGMAHPDAREESGVVEFEG